VWKVGGEVARGAHASGLGMSRVALQTQREAGQTRASAASAVNRQVRFRRESVIVWRECVRECGERELERECVCLIVCGGSVCECVKGVCKRVWRESVRVWRESFIVCGERK